MENLPQKTCFISIISMVYDECRCMVQKNFMITAVDFEKKQLTISENSENSEVTINFSDLNWGDPAGATVNLETFEKKPVKYVVQHCYFGNRIHPKGTQLTFADFLKRENDNLSFHVDKEDNLHIDVTSLTKRNLQESDQALFSEYRFVRPNLQKSNMTFCIWNRKNKAFHNYYEDYFDFVEY